MSRKFDFFLFPSRSQRLVLRVRLYGRFFSTRFALLRRKTFHQLVSQLSPVQRAHTLNKHWIEIAPNLLQIHRHYGQKSPEQFDVLEQILLDMPNYIEVRERKDLRQCRPTKKPVLDLLENLVVPFAGETQTTPRAQSHVAGWQTVF